MRRRRAFTLVEILVAMAILAIALAATTRAASLAIDSSRDTRARLLATWSAANRVAELRARGTFPAPAVSSAAVEQGGLSLVVQETVADTANPTIRRVDLSVADARDPGRVLVTHTAFLVKP